MSNGLSDPRPAHPIYRQVGLLRSWASSQVNARHDAGTEDQNATRRGDVEGSS